MTTVVAIFKYQGELGMTQAQKLGASYINLGVRKVLADETKHIIAVEYDATRMDRNGVAAMLRRLAIPILEAVEA